MKWEHEMEQVIELAELAEEAAMAELAAFGCYWPEEAMRDDEFNEDGCEPFWQFAYDLYEVGDTWREQYVLTELF